MRVAFFLRKRYKGVFSIESLFMQLMTSMPPAIEVVPRPARFYSQGFFKRLVLIWDAFLGQEEINHVTGDIHFIALALPGKKTVLTIHDIGFMKHPNLFFRLLLKWFWLKLPIRHCAAVTVVSEATKNDILKYVNPSYRNKIHVIHNPIKPLFLPYPKNFNKNEPIILQLGTKYNKNLLRLIEALAPIKCKLQIVGELTAEHLHHLQLHRINYLGSNNLTDLEILDKYKECDIVSFISINEGFGLPIIEANAVGRVVITSNLSSMPEVAGGGAHLVDPYDIADIQKGFMRIINDSDYRTQLIQNGYENVNRFKVDTIVQNYIDIYSSFKRTNQS